MASTIVPPAPAASVTVDQGTLTSTPSVTNEGSWVYNHWLKSSVDQPYDTRIDDYNWVMLIGAQCIGYFILHVIMKLIAPAPGKKEDFI